MSKSINHYDDVLSSLERERTRPKNTVLRKEYTLPKNKTVKLDDRVEKILVAKEKLKVKEATEEKPKVIVQSKPKKKTTTVSNLSRASDIVKRAKTKKSGSSTSKDDVIWLL